MIMIFDPIDLLIGICIGVVLAIGIFWALYGEKETPIDDILKEGRDEHEEGGVG